MSTKTETFSGHPRFYTEAFSVDWAYPTSDSAKKFGCYQTGCFVVNDNREAKVSGWTKGPVAIEGFKTREEAEEHCALLNFIHTEKGKAA